MHHQIRASVLLAKPYRGCRNSHSLCPSEGNCEAGSSSRELKTSPSTQLGQPWQPVAPGITPASKGMSPRSDVFFSSLCCNLTRDGVTSEPYCTQAHKGLAPMILTQNLPQPVCHIKKALPHAGFSACCILTILIIMFYYILTFIYLFL